jgi:hypothetical protein
VIGITSETTIDFVGISIIDNLREQRRIDSAPLREIDLPLAFGGQSHLEIN